MIARINIEHCTLRYSLNRFQHIFVRDQRDNTILPSDGQMLRVVQELAGLGGDVNYLKHEDEFQINKSLIYDTVRAM